MLRVLLRNASYTVGARVPEGASALDEQLIQSVLCVGGCWLLHNQEADALLTDK